MQDCDLTALLLHSIQQPVHTGFLGYAAAGDSLFNAGGKLLSFAVQASLNAGCMLLLFAVQASLHVNSLDHRGRAAWGQDQTASVRVLHA